MFAELGRHTANNRQLIDLLGDVREEIVLDSRFSVTDLDEPVLPTSSNWVRSTCTAGLAMHFAKHRLGIEGIDVGHRPTCIER